MPTPTTPPADALFALGAFGRVSMVSHGALVQLDTPEDLRGRASAVNAIFSTTSNQLGEFEPACSPRGWAL